MPPPGEPPPSCGLRYVSVWPGGTKFGTEPGKVTHVRETYDLGVTVSWRISHVPKDRVGRKAWFEAVTGLEALVRKVLLAIHGSETLIYAVANGKLGAGVNGFLELLAGPANVSQQVVSGAWFGGDQANTKAGLIVPMTFSGAKRLQALGSAT